MTNYHKKLGLNKTGKDLVNQQYANRFESHTRACPKYPDAHPQDQSIDELRQFLCHKLPRKHFSQKQLLSFRQQIKDRLRDNV